MSLHPITFTPHRVKMYARTPMGETAVSDTQHYAWIDGKLTKYGGGDMQCASNGVLWTKGPPNRLDEATMRGYAAAFDRRRLN